MNDKWHYVNANDYPEVFGNYKNMRYPQIPCIIEDDWGYGVRYWNVTEQCWDTEDRDDYYSDKDKILRWRYLDPLIN